MRPICLMLLAALFSGCASPGTPIDKRVGRTEFAVVVQFLPRESTHPVCSQIGGALLPITHVNIDGCFQWEEHKRRCTLWVPEPDIVEDHKSMAVIGHELLHCVFHKFHP